MAARVAAAAACFACMQMEMLCGQWRCCAILSGSPDRQLAAPPQVGSFTLPCCGPVRCIAAEHPPASTDGRPESMTMQVAKQEKTNALCPKTMIPDHTTIINDGLRLHCRNTAAANTLLCRQQLAQAPVPSRRVSDEVTNQPGAEMVIASMEKMRF